MQILGAYREGAIKINIDLGVDHEKLTRVEDGPRTIYQELQKISSAPSPVVTNDCWLKAEKQELMHR
jgi:hypothetical protein